MTFAAYEASRDAGNPVSLYKFVYGTEAGQYYAYTDHTEELTVDGVTYAPVPIKRGNVVSNGTLDKSAIKISTDVGTNLAEIFRIYPPASVVSPVTMRAMRSSGGSQRMPSSIAEGSSARSERTASS